MARPEVQPSRTWKSMKGTQSFQTSPTKVTRDPTASIGKFLIPSRNPSAPASTPGHISWSSGGEGEREQVLAGCEVGAAVDVAVPLQSALRHVPDVRELHPRPGGESNTSA